MGANHSIYVLAIDLGTSGAKVGLVSGSGEILGWEFEPTPLYMLPEGGCEQDPHEWWQAILQAAHRLLDKRLVPVEEIMALSCTSQWSGTVAVDQNGDPLMNAIIWLDTRGAHYVQEVSRGFLSIEGYDPLKLLTWLRLAGCPPEASGKGPPGHILFIKHERPEVYQQAAKFLEPKDYLNYRLTGIAAASYDSISLHGLTDTRDIRRVHYDPRLFRLYRFNPEQFPPLRQAVDFLGTLTPRAASELGLSSDVKVVTGAPDVLATAIGLGAVEDFQPHLYLGTSSWISCHVPFKKTDVFHSIASFPSAIPGRYLMIDEQDWAGGCLNFLLENVFFRPDSLSAQEQPADAHIRLNQLAGQSPPGSNQVIFTPWLYGERAPVQDAWLRAGFFNLSPSKTRADLVRAVFEGVALNARWLLGYADKFCKRRLDGIHLVGGGAISEVWCQIFADVLDRTFLQIEDPRLVTLRGAAFLALVAVGCLHFEEIPGKIKIQNTFRPDPQNRPVYDKLFREFVNLYRATQPIYRRLNDGR